jgi:hypothetical protein
MKQFWTPILFIVFNRIDTTQRVFNEIKKRQPRFLYIAADGPRSDKEGEAEKCQQVRDIIKQIDWDCELKTLFRNENLGCAKGPSTAITWFFENEEQGIILEDDCLPHPDFFIYCEELLEKYKNQENVALIGAINFQDGIKRGDDSYYFSAHPHIWGWASWRRTWAGYDLFLKNYSLEEYKKALFRYYPSGNVTKSYIDTFQIMKKQGNDAWDYQLTAHIWREHGICIIPNVNLVLNIGFGDNSTHTKNMDKTYSAVQLSSILPLTHPSEIKRNLEADNYHCKNHLFKAEFYIPIIKKTVPIPKNILWYMWRWVRRQLLIKPKFHE